MASPMTNASVLAILRAIAADVGMDRAARRGIRGTRGRRLCGHRHPQPNPRWVLLVADAAGYIDAFTGEGMGLAFGAAELAGIALSANGPRTTTASGAGRRDGIPH